MKRLTFLSIILVYSTSCIGQGWVQANGTANQIFNALIPYSGDTLLAGADRGGVYVSYDNGANWNPYALSNQTVTSLAKIGDVVLAGTDGSGIFRNINLGSTWLNIPINNQYIYSFTNHNDTLYFNSGGTMGPGGVYLTVDTGKTWIQYLNGQIFRDIDFNRSNNRTLVATSSGAFFVDNQDSLIATTGVNGTIRTVAHLNGDTIIYGADFFGTYISYDNGVSGQLMNSSNGSGAIFRAEDTMYRASNNGSLIYNHDINSIWQALPVVNSSLAMNSNVLSVIKNNGRLITGTFTGIYYYSSSLTVGVNEIDISEQKFLLSPNPNHGAFSLKVEESESDLTVRLFNNHGKLISKQLCSSSKGMTFDFDIPSGIYFLKIETVDKPLGSIKFVVL